jgi:hypothetical protein
MIRLADMEISRRYVRVRKAESNSKPLEPTQLAQDLLKYINPIHESALAKDGLQIFLLGKPAKTNFRKDLPVGLFGNHLYFWDIARQVNAESAESLALALTGKFWSEFRI